MLNKATFKKYLDARDDFLRGKYKLAINKLISLDVAVKNHDINHLLVKCLYRQKSYNDAEQVLLADVNSYTSSEALINLMLDVLLKNHEFVMCREIVASFNDTQLVSKFLQRIKYCEAVFTRKDIKILRLIAKRFYHLSDYSLIKQRVIFRSAQRLPLQNYLSISKKLLIDPFLSPIMRLSILDTLRKMNLRIQLKYRWIDRHTYLINIGQLLGLTQTKSYRLMMKLVNQRYYHDPSRMLALKQNLRLDLSYLYPFNDHEIRDPKLWIKIANLRIEGKQPVFKNVRVKNVYYLQVRLNQITKNMIK